MDGNQQQQPGEQQQQQQQQENDQQIQPQHEEQQVQQVEHEEENQADAGNNSSENILNNVERDLENGAQRRNNRTGNNLNPRDRLFYALFIKIGQLYARCVPKKLRTVLEVAVLLKGLLLFSFLSYLHFSFGKVPMNCLNSTIGSWPRDGVLRVQVQTETNLEIQLPRFYSYRKNIVLFHPCHNEKERNSSLCTTLANDLELFYKYHERRYAFKEQCYRLNLSSFMYIQNSSQWKNYENFEYIFSDRSGKLFKGFSPGEIVKEDKVADLYEKYFTPSKPERLYVFEYAQEFGFLRISKEARSRLKIPIKTVNFDPNKEKCFGDMFSRFILKYFLGYDDVIMNSIKKIADAENNTGYMLNVVTGDHYKFVSWGMGRSSYFISLLLMFLFTISISTLLRYCHQQVFFFIIHLLQMMDMNVVLAFPIAPLFTVILSLVGMETIMSEYFNDTTTSFYIILIVWAVDQFDTICCHTEISQKYWLRFFYLYHFIFYSYHYRFNGQYSSIALAATWFLIQHSMFYFLHNYELPAIENEANNGRRDEDAYLDEAVQIIVEGIEMVAGQQNNVNQPPAAPINENGGVVANEENQVNAANNVEEQHQENERREPLDYMVHRVILFATDTSFLQTFREFIRLVLERMNIDRRNAAIEEQPNEQIAHNSNLEETVGEYHERPSAEENYDLSEADNQSNATHPLNVSQTKNFIYGTDGQSSRECSFSGSNCDLQLCDIAQHSNSGGDERNVPSTLECYDNNAVHSELMSDCAQNHNLIGNSNLGNTSEESRSVDKTLECDITSPSPGDLPSSTNKQPEEEEK